MVQRNVYILYMRLIRCHSGPWNQHFSIILFPREYCSSEHYSQRILFLRALFPENTVPQSIIPREYCSSEHYFQRILFLRALFPENTVPQSIIPREYCSSDNRHKVGNKHSNRTRISPFCVYLLKHIGIPRSS